MGVFKQNIKYYWVILFAPIIIVAASFFFSERYGKYEGRWLNTISGDGFGYYAYLNAVFLPSGFDFDMEKDGLHYGKYPVHPYDLLAFDADSSRYTKYFPGTAILMSPFYLTGAMLAYVSGEDVDGFSPPFQYMVLFSTLFYLLFSLVLLTKLLRTFNLSDTDILFILLPIAIGTNAINYVWNEASYSHVYVFFSVSGFLYCMRLFFIQPRYSSFLWAAAFLGLGIIIRPTSVLAALAIPLLSENLDNLKQLIEFKLKQWKTTVLAGLLIFMFIGVYLLTNYLQFGKWQLWTYTGEYFDFLNPNLQAFLFSYKKGLFVYTPLLLLIVPASLSLWNKNKFFVLSFASFFLVTTYILSSWWAWSYGGSFGSRAFIDYLPVVSVFFGRYLSYAELSRVRMTGLVTFIVLCMGLNLIQNFQYTRQIIDYDNMDDEKYWQVFLKTDDLYRWVNVPEEDFLKNRKILQVMSWQNDFDEKQDWPTNNTLVSWPINSPNKGYGHSVMLNKEQQYGALFSIPADSIRNNSLDIVAEISMSTILGSSYCDAKAVVNVKSQNNGRWTGKKIISQARRKGEWFFVKYQFNVGKLELDDTDLEFYILHDHKKPIWIDNINYRVYFLEKR